MYNKLIRKMPPKKSEEDKQNNDLKVYKILAEKSEKKLNKIILDGYIYTYKSN